MVWHTYSRYYSNMQITIKLEWKQQEYYHCLQVGDIKFGAILSNRRQDTNPGYCAVCYVNSKETDQYKSLEGAKCWVEDQIVKAIT